MQVEIDILKVNEVIKNYLKMVSDQKIVTASEALTFIHKYLCDEYREQQNEKDKWSNTEEAKTDEYIDHIRTEAE